MIITILIFLGILAVLILAHELGHFATAKAFGVRVDEFGLGFPPRLIGIKRGETTYSLNAVPLGGFTKMAGEEDPDVPRSLASKSVGARVIVLSAGSIMNVLLPILLFSIAFMVPHNVVTGDVVVAEVVPNSPAAAAGIEVGDIILSLNDEPVNSIGDLQIFTHLNLGKEVNLAVRHSDAAIEEVRLIPRWKPPPGEGAMGVALSMPDAVIVRQSYPFWEAIPMGVSECIETFVIFKNEILKWFIGATPVQVTGPVGIAQMTGEVAKAGLSPLLRFAGFISINLALVNILPLPALDGGRIVFVLLGWVRRGKRISPKTEGLVHAIGFALLIAAMIALTYQDIIRIIAGESLIP
ncbi:MAG: site-2 protease family protein [Deltaproteobacteria bacterium]|nr:site-2 protease family protein [Deltaproteobacteria bacterium]